MVTPKNSMIQRLIMENPAISWAWPHQRPLSSARPTAPCRRNGPRCWRRAFCYRPGCHTSRRTRCRCTAGSWAAGQRELTWITFVDFFLQVGGMIVERSRSWGWNAAHRSILLILTYTNVTNTSCFMVIQVGVNGVDSSCRRSNFHIITLISSTTWLVQEVRQPFPISKAAWWCIGSSSNPCPTFWRTSLCWRRVCSWASSSFCPGCSSSFQSLPMRTWTGTRTRKNNAVVLLDLVH